MFDEIIAYFLWLYRKLTKTSHSLLSLIRYERIVLVKQHSYLADQTGLDVEHCVEGNIPVAG